MPTRATFAPTPNSARSTFSSLVAVSNKCQQHALESCTRHILLDSIIFLTSSNKRLVLVSCKFVNFDHFIPNHQSLQKCLGAASQPRFWLAPARAAFEMLLWLMICFAKLLLPHLDFAATSYKTGAKLIEWQRESHMDPCGPHGHILTHMTHMAPYDSYGPIWTHMGPY